MSATVRELRPKPAKRPEPRTIEVGIPEGDFAGWRCTARVDFPAKHLAALQSRDAMAFLEVMDAIIVEHNFPNAQDELAESMADVDPYSGLVAIARAVFDAIGSLGPR